MRRIQPLASRSFWYLAAFMLVLAVTAMPVGAAPFSAPSMDESNTAILMMLGLSGLVIAGRPRSESDCDGHDGVGETD